MISVRRERGGGDSSSDFLDGGEEELDVLGIDDLLEDINLWVFGSDDGVDGDSGALWEFQSESDLIKQQLQKVSRSEGELPR